MYFVAQSHIIQILIPYLLGFFSIYCRNPNLPLNGSNCSLMQTADPTKYSDLHKPMNMSHISRNAAFYLLNDAQFLLLCHQILSLTRETRNNFFAMTAGKTNLRVPSTLYSDSMCSCEDSNTPP